jgi:hypothetical protein
MLVVFLFACGGGESPAFVGETCDLQASPNEIVVQQPISACGSKICLHVTSSTPDLCTNHCETADDCVEAEGSLCNAGFECEPVLSIGPFACQKFCVCADRVPATSCP